MFTLNSADMSVVSKTGKSRFAGIVMLVIGGFTALLSGGMYAIYSIKGMCYAIYPGGQCTTGLTEGNILVTIGLMVFSTCLVVAGLVVMKLGKNKTHSHTV